MVQDRYCEVFDLGGSAHRTDSLWKHSLQPICQLIQKHVSLKQYSIDILISNIDYVVSYLDRMLKAPHAQVSSLMLPD